MTRLPTIERFGTGTQVYEFPDAVTSWRSNFSRLMTQSDRLPGLNGGYDIYGSIAAPSDIGLVDVSFWLVGLSPEQMAAEKDKIRAMSYWGKRALFVQPYDETLNERYCYARIREIVMDEDADKGTYRNQEVRITFEVPEARWYAFNTSLNLSLWDDPASVWGKSTCIWGGSAATPFTGPGPLDLTFTNSGNAVSLPIIKITCGAGQTVVNPVIQRIESGLIKESIAFLGTIGNNQAMIIDCQRLQAKLNSTDIYDALSILKSNWLSIRPGTNLIRFLSNSAADAGGIKVQFIEAFY